MLEKISDDIVSAMRSKDKDRLRTLRGLKSALKNKEIELRKAIDDETVLNVLASEVKRREQAIELYIQGGRDDLADLEKQEIEIIKEYLPEPLTEEELRSAVDEVISAFESESGESASMKQMGMVMKTLKESLGNRADGKVLSNIVRSKLSN